MKTNQSIHISILNKNTKCSTPSKVKITLNIIYTISGGIQPINHGCEDLSFPFFFYIFFGNKTRG